MAEKAQDIIIEDLDQLEIYAYKRYNMRLVGLIRKFKNAGRDDDRVLALAAIINTLKRRGIKYSSKFIRNCLLYFCT